MKYHLISLGCATNKADTERIASVLDSMGHEPTENEDEATILGLVACSIRQSAIDRVYGKVHNWNKRKNTEQLVTLVSGCILPSDEQKFLKLFDFVLPLKDVARLPQLMKQYGTIAPESFWDINPRRSSDFKALIPIQNGCDKFCTYCAVPYTRGREVSRPSDEILKEIDRCIENGYKQITLLGQNVNSYGLDKPGEERTFAELLEEIGKRTDAAPHRMWVHYTSPHPRDMNEDVYQVQAAHPSLANYLNLPMQSGDSDVLRRMNRRYKIEEYMRKLDMARTFIPDISVSTDVIVGFCGETAEQFDNTVTAMERGQFDMAFIAQYSPRPGAVAEKRFPDDVAKEEKKRRDVTLNEMLKKTALAQNKKLEGKRIPVLIEAKSRKPGKLLGRTEGLKSVEVEAADEQLIGQFVWCTIESVESFRMMGRIDGDANANPLNGSSAAENIPQSQSVETIAV